MSKAKLQKLYILAGVLIFFCAAAFAVSKWEEKKEVIKNSDEIILSLDTDTVTALSWEYDDTELAFHKEEIWIYDEDEAFPVDEEKIEALLELFQEFGVSFRIEDVEEEGQYGLDDPVCTIRLTLEEENTETDEEMGSREYEIRLGDYSTMDEKRYVSIGDGNVYLVQHDPMEEYEITIRDLILQDTVPYVYDADTLQLEGQENYTIVYEEDNTNTYREEDVYFTEGKPLDTALVESYLNTLRNLALTEYVSYRAEEEDLSTYGLEDPALTITMKYSWEKEDGEEEEDTFVLHLGKNLEELEKAKESKEEDAEYNVAAYARVGDSQKIYQITSLEYEQLTKASYDDLRHKEVLTAEMEDITGLEISLDGEEYILTAEGEEEEQIWYYGEEEIDASSLKNALEYLKADSFTEEKPSGKEEIHFEAVLNAEDETKVSVSLYRYDGEKCLAVVDGVSFAFVSRSDVVELIEAVHGIVW